MCGVVVNGVAAPEGWEDLPLKEIGTLARRLGVVYWVDEDAIARQVRKAILAASEVDFTAPSINPRVTPEEEARHARATAMRDEGATWQGVAVSLGYPSGGAARSAVVAHCRRNGRTVPSPPRFIRAGAREKAEAALALRTDGKSWREVAVALGWINGNAARGAVKHYCDVTGHPFPYGIMGRRQPNGKPSHCLNGHEYTTENTHVLNSGSWQCRTCRRARRQRERERGYR